MVMNILQRLVSFSGSGGGASGARRPFDDDGWTVGSTTPRLTVPQFREFLSCGYGTPPALLALMQSWKRLEDAELEDFEMQSFDLE